MSEWTSRLRRASFRGVPFAVLADSAVVGRRQAVHEFPGRDTPYAEDMGKATRRRTLQGFLVENSAIYGGGDVIAQRDRIEAAAEAYGPGTLVHPTKGPLSISLQQLSISERWDQGRYFELNFEFVEAGAPAFSLGILSTVSNVLGLAATAMDVFSSAFGAGASALSAVTAAGSYVAPGGPTAYAINTDAAAAASTFAAKAYQLGADAGSAFNLTRSTIGDASEARVAISSAGSDLVLAASRLNTAMPDFSAVSFATSKLIASVTNVSADPGDAIRLTSQLAAGG
jgi:hypothetical protein